MDGILNINKPAGMTSHDVVARVRRALKTKRAGHAGTLDPDATGVLVVAVGQATRLLPHLPLEPKIYVARAVFGAATTTEDASGDETETADASALTEETLREAIPQFLGDIEQVPPMVSAVHHEGRRLYELAREGITVEREARIVHIFAVQMDEFVPGERAEAVFHVACGGGTYIRTLCADLGKAVGLPAHMKTLRRDAVGRFEIVDAITLDTLKEQGTETPLLPMESVLTSPQIHLSEADASDILLGRAIAIIGDAENKPHSEISGGEVSLLFHDKLLALARYDTETGTMHPFKVFPTQVGKTNE